MFKMKLHTLAAAILSLTLLGNAQAQMKAQGEFIGLDKLTVTENFKPIMLFNAINSKDWNFVKEWGTQKSFKFNSSKTKGCGVIYGEDHSSFHNFDLKQTADGYVNLVGNVARGIYPVFAVCEEIPILHTFKHSDRKHTASYVQAYPSHISPDQSKVNEQNLITSFQKQMIADLTPAQADLLIFVVLDNNVDFELRKQALTKYKEWMKNFNSIGSLEHKALRASLKSEEAKKAYYLERGLNQAFINDPLYFMFEQLMSKMAIYTREFKDEPIYKDPNTPKFTKDFWSGKQTISIKDFSINPAYGNKISSVLQFMQNAELVKDIMYSDGFNINKQDFNGNTYMHKMWLSDAVQKFRLENQPILASFYRFLLENGANPNLLNKENKTAMMLFETFRTNDPSFAPFYEAMTERNFK